MKTITLKTGYKIPQLGLGTWQLTGTDCVNSVKKAIELGYRHIDTADAYGNHKQVASAIKKSGINRDKLFVTSKIFRSNLHAEDIRQTGKRILAELDLDYLNLLLIHWPNKNVPISETLQAMVELMEEGLVKDIGVSNFTINHVKDTMEFTDLISVNQVEFHPYLYQKDLLNFCQDNEIAITAYSPLARGQVFNEEILLDFAKKYDKSPAQLVLRWLIEKDIIVIPKASSEDHIKDNMDIFDWELPAEVKDYIDNLHSGKRLIDPGFGEFDY